MSTEFVVTAKINPGKFADTVSEGDASTYSIDFRPWQSDNSTITSVTWTVETGTATISNTALSSGIATALITFTQDGLCVISALATTASEKKKVWIEVNVRDLKYPADDYGMF